MKNGKIGKLCLDTAEQQQQFHRKTRIAQNILKDTTLKFRIYFAAMKLTKIDKIEKLPVL